jgi:AcrR family transcriptional regulator
LQPELLAADRETLWSQAAPTSSGPRRADARRNRDALVVAARAGFAEGGADAPLEQIALDAGVAIGTLYRHFPTRADLLMAAYEPQLAQLVEYAETALRMQDPLEGFCCYLELLFLLQTDNRGLNDFISTRFPVSARTNPLAGRLCSLIERLLERAKRSGQLRPDIEKADIISLIWANGRIIEATRPTAPHAWRRQLHLMIDAYRADRATHSPSRR